MAAKRKKRFWLFALVALLFATATFASIPKPDTLLQPSIDRFTIDIGEEAVDEIPRLCLSPLAGVVGEDQHLDDRVLLRAALESAIPAPVPLEILSESRVWVFELETPLFHQEISPLSRSLQKASAVVWWEIASGTTVLTPDPLGYRDSSNLYAFCAGDPVNLRDPTGEFTWVKAPIETFDVSAPTAQAAAVEAQLYLSGEEPSLGGDAIAYTKPRGQIKDGTMKRFVQYDPAGVVKTDVQTGTAWVTGRPEVIYKPLIMMPRWVEYESAPEAEQDKWDATLHRLLEHERTHERLSAVVYNIWEVRLRALQQSTEDRPISGRGRSKGDLTTKLMGRLQRLIDEVVQKVPLESRRMNAEFHCEVDEGRCDVSWTPEKERQLIRSEYGEKGVRLLNGLTPVASEGER